MQFRSLENIEKAELINVFNSAFADYFVNVSLDEKSLAIKITTENIALENSVGAFFDEKLVGFMLLGIENGIAFNGGTGVLPQFRGNALTVKMYDFILPKLKAEGIFSNQLEVITKNIAAIKCYEKTGFARTRTLVCFKGKITIEKLNKNVELKFLHEIDEMLFSSFWNSQPSWQNSLSAIKRTQNLYKIVGAFYQSNLVGYVIYSEKATVKQFGVKKDFRHFGIGQTLFSRINNQEIVITNIDKKDQESVTFLRKLGLDLFLEQFEMNLIV